MNVHEETDGRPDSEVRVSRSALERQKILIVDDKKENLFALRRVLSDLEVDIIEATSGNEALAATIDHHFAMAILDVMMPGMGGYELAEYLRGDAKTRRMPIIFLTAFSSDDERVFKGYEVGGVDYIVKPYNPDVLVAKVSIFLDLEKARAELADKIVALITSEERYRSLVMTIPDIVYRIDTDGRFTYLNDAVKALGYVPEDLLGSHFSKILVPANVENLSRKSVLPTYKGKSTGPEGAPRLFDERRTGKRITKGLEVRLMPLNSGRISPVVHYSGRSDVMIAEINSSGIYAGDPYGKKTTLLGTVGVIRDNTERKRAGEELEKHRDKLKDLVKERVKEQVCLYRISEELAKLHESVDDILRQSVDLISLGFRYPEITSARLNLDDRTVTSKHFRESQWRLTADIVIKGKMRGTVEVFSLEEKSADQEPFLKEEKDLILGISRMLAQALERMEAITRERHLNAVLRGIRNINKLIITEKIRTRLIHTACEGLVRDRGFKRIWIVLTDQLPESVEAAHCSLSDNAFSELVNVFQKGELPACCRRSRAEPGIIKMKNPALDCKGCPQAEDNKGTAALVTKLEYEGTLFGYMGVYVPLQFAEDMEERSLLGEISGDIPFALHNMKIEEKRKQAEEELRQYEHIVSSTADMLALVDRRFVYLSANKAYFQVFGRTSDVIIGRTVSEVFGEEFFQTVIRPKAERCLAGEEIRYQAWIEFPAAGRKYMDVACFPYIGQDAEVQGFVIAARDNTERESLQAQLAQAQKMESIGRLAGGVAHDYNNALSVIMGYTELSLDDMDLTATLRGNLDEILKAAIQATDITRQLLAFARKQTIIPTVLDINENVEGMLKMLQRLIGEDIDLAWLPGASLWPVKMDPSQIDQILANLFVNARDAIAGVGKITIETENVTIDAAFCADHVGFNPGEFVLLSVSDNGCGMEKEILNNIFEPFFTTKDMDKGTGLGLSTVYGIVRQNNGFINVYSEPGKGTVIRIYLSRYEGEDVVIREEITEEIPVGRGETVLLVEDDLSILKLARNMLDVLGYAVLTAGTPNEALNLAREHAGEIHLLITDVIMPEMNGRELEEKLQTFYPNLKCMFMSGYTANVIARHGVLDKGVRFVQKPFSKRGLATTVRRALDD